MNFLKVLLEFENENFQDQNGEREELRLEDIAGIERNISRMSSRIDDLTLQINDLSNQITNRQQILDSIDESQPGNLRVMDLLSHEIEQRTLEIDNIINNEINLNQLREDIN